MDYKPLIEKAIQRHKWTRYRLAKELGFKAVSAIYRVENGENGLSAPKLMRLLELAGKTLAGAALVISAALPFTSAGDVHAAERSHSDAAPESARHLTLLYIMRSIARRIVRALGMVVSSASAYRHASVQA